MNFKLKYFIAKTSLLSKAFAVLFLIGFVACKKDPKEEPKTTSAKDVYVAGSESNGAHYVAKIWHNGVAVNLTDGNYDAYANTVILSDTDVYVKGTEVVGKIEIGRIWKNGILIFSTDSRFTNNLKSIFIDGKDVYAVGDEYEPNVGVRQKFWKNAVLVSETFEHASTDGYSIEDIFVKDKDVYIAGTIGNTSSYYSCYWKNGKLNKMPMIGDLNLNWGMKIFVEGSNVFLLGRGQESGISQTAMVWKNNLLDFKDALYNSFPTSLYISGGNFYFTGAQLTLGSEIKTSGDNDWYAFICTSGKFGLLGTTGSNANDVKVHEGDTYVSGYYFNGIKNVATIWENGIAHNITDGTKDAAAYSVFVK